MGDRVPRVAAGTACGDAGAGDDAADTSGSGAFGGDAVPMPNTASNGRRNDDAIAAAERAFSCRAGERCTAATGEYAAL